jgi:hypothetical protein
VQYALSPYSISGYPEKQQLVVSGKPKTKQLLVSGKPKQLLLSGKKRNNKITRTKSTQQPTASLEQKPFTLPYSTGLPHPNNILKFHYFTFTPLLETKRNLFLHPPPSRASSTRH